MRMENKLGVADVIVCYGLSVGRDWNEIKRVVGVVGGSVKGGRSGTSAGGCSRLFEVNRIGRVGRGVLLLGRRGRGLDVVGQPGQAFEQTFSRGGARRHDVPDLVLKLVQLQRVGNFLWLHGYYGHRSLAAFFYGTPSRILNIGTWWVLVWVSGELGIKWEKGGARDDLPSLTSCLFAKTSSRLSFISRSLMMRCNSCLASSIRARSAESITKIRPCVPKM